MEVYAGSDDAFYTEADVSYQFETGAWELGLLDPDEGWWVVEAADQQLLWLVPIDEADLPEGVEVRDSEAGTTVADPRDS